MPLSLGATVPFSSCDVSFVAMSGLNCATPIGVYCGTSVSDSVGKIIPSHKGKPR